MISLDLETECAKPGCTDSACSHALIPHHARITVAAVAWREGTEIKAEVYRDLVKLEDRILTADIVGHNAKFDIKMLRYHGVNVDLEQYVDDSALMATASYEKVSPEYLEWYERERKRLNKGRKGNSHREAGQHSLKTCAPYFLGVDPFWEAEDHDNDEYVTKDAVYSLLLAEKMEGMLKKQGTYDFYRNYLMPWSKMFLRAEERGVLLDFKRIDEMEPEAKRLAAHYSAELDKVWASGHEAYFKKQDDELWREYQEKAQAARIKMKNPTENKCIKLNARYNDLYEKARAKLDRKVNLGSPTQLRWLLKDHLGLDIRGLDGEESTDKEVLELLAGQGREDVSLLLKWREQEKLVGTYFAAYRDLASPRGSLHPSFNLDIARTGRTSCNTPNLQNQPGELHEVFIARPGYKLITKDLSAIEPAVVAFYSEDPLLVDLIQRGDDFHGTNAKIVFDAPDWVLAKVKKEHPEERNASKEFGLSVLYGAQHVRTYICLTKRRFPRSMKECKQIVRRIRDAYPDVTEFKLAIDELAYQGQPIENLFGRKRVFAEEEVYMKAFNDLIQGTANAIMLESARRAQDEFDTKGIDAHLLMTIHDEGVFEVPDVRANECDEIITRHMTSWHLPTAMGLVPLRVEGKISDRWEK